MQLSKSKAKSALFAASCTLLSVNSLAEEWSEGVEVDAALMVYSETDRVQALEGVLHVNKAITDDKELAVNVVFDTLTGASANGAVPQRAAQTFTSPSGNHEYSIAQEETPLDSTFRDTRLQLSGQWSQGLGENYTFSGGMNASREYDYRSLALNGLIGRSFNMKNTTLSAGLSYSLDSIGAVGGRPVGLSAMQIRSQFDDEDSYRDAFNVSRENGDESKATVDLILGLTQVINRRWITQLNIGFSEVDGYLTDPYKVISAVDSTGLAVTQRYEQRPDSRSKQSLYGQSKVHFSHGIWDFSYRFSHDDWGVKSHTLDSRYLFLWGGISIEPHLRVYQQQEADFYQAFLLEAEVLPRFASADYRIGRLNTYTLGARVAKKLKHEQEFGVRLEYYMQSSRGTSIDVPGQLQGLDLYPDLDAVILQFDYQF